MVVVSWPLNDDPTNRDLSWWRCPHGDSNMSLCVRCYHPFDFIYVELKRHRPRCPRWYSGRHRLCVGFSPFSRMFAPFYSLWPWESRRWVLRRWPSSDQTIKVPRRIGIVCTATVIVPYGLVHDRCYRGTHGIYVTLFGKTGLNENSVVMHFECVDNALQCVDNGF